LGGRGGFELEEEEIFTLDIEGEDDWLGTDELAVGVGKEVPTLLLPERESSLEAAAGRDTVVDEDAVVAVGTTEAVVGEVEEGFTVGDPLLLGDVAEEGFFTVGDILLGDGAGIELRVRGLELEEEEISILEVVEDEEEEGWLGTDELAVGVGKEAPTLLLLERESSLEAAGRDTVVDEDAVEAVVGEGEVGFFTVEDVLLFGDEPEEIGVTDVIPNTPVAVEVAGRDDAAGETGAFRLWDKFGV